MHLEIDLPIAPADEEELLSVAAFFQTIVEGVATRYPGRAPRLIIALKRVPDDVRAALTEQGWTLEFEDGFWRARAPFPAVARPAGREPVTRGSSTLVPKDERTVP